MSFANMLTIILMAFKLSGTISVPWFIVLAPIAAHLMLRIIAFIAYLIEDV